MRLAGQTYFAPLETGGAPGMWHAMIPFADGDFVELTRQIHSGRDDSAAAFADVILRTLEARRASFLTPTALVEPCYAVSRTASAGS
jgi:hypothetical protein